jgi:hypothetical protein
MWNLFFDISLINIDVNNILTDYIDYKKYNNYGYGHTFL